MFTTPVIETDRMILRKMQENDFDCFKAYYTEPSITDFLGGYPDVSEEGTKIMFRSNCLTSLTWALELKESGKVIGDIHFGDILTLYLAHIGYIMNKDYWGRGYMREAVEAVVAYAFDVLGFGRIRAVTIIRNERSIQLLEKCGFRREALIYESDYGGRIADVYYYSISKYDL